MRRHLLKSKIHPATITSVELNYEGSGIVQLNGAAARMGLPGDNVIVMSYAAYDESEAQQHQPGVVLVDPQNYVVRPPLRAES